MRYGSRSEKKEIKRLERLQANVSADGSRAKSEFVAPCANEAGISPSDARKIMEGGELSRKFKAKQGKFMHAAEKSHGSFAAYKRAYDSLTP